MNETIKVCHFTSVHQWNDIRIFQKECTALAEAGFEVHLVAANGVNGSYNGVQVHNVEYKSSGRLDRMRNLARKVYEKAKEIDADIYHFHDPELLPYGLKLQKQGKKVIYDAHEDMPASILSKKWIKPQLLRSIISQVYNSYEKNISNKLSGVISVLPILTKKFNNSHTETIHNYPKLDFFTKENKIRDFDVKADTFKLVYNGGLTEIRGIDKMIEAMGLLDPNYELLLMGSWESDAYFEKCKSIKGWDNVKYLGNLPIQDCLEQVQKAHTGLVLFTKVPNHLHSLPNKSFEFMAARLPVIMTDIPFWMEQFSEYAHFVDINNPKTIASKIIDIKNNYNIEQEKCVRVGESILKEKSWENERIKLINLYHKILTDSIHTQRK